MLNFTQIFTDLFQFSIILGQSEMSQSINSDDSGFRSRERQRIKRQQARKKIMQTYKNNNGKKLINYSQDQNNKNSDQQPRKYMKIQQLAELHKNQDFINYEDQGDDIDMFGSEDSQKQQKNDEKSNKKIHSDQTDDQGYYVVIENKVIGEGKYKILQKLGKGMFGSVIKACRVQNQTDIFAIKIIRKNDMMQQSGQNQYEIISSIKKSEYIMKVFDYFFQEGHLCLVCELMGEDLRSYVRKHQNTVNLDEIKKYAISMFMSLHQLRKNAIIHADIKPDNFLFNADHSKVKLCDFGTSYRIDQHSSQIQYLVARYYRAPEIMLGYSSNSQNRHHIDTWAVACSLFQLYTGQFLFNGSSNNQMLKQIMQTKGKFNIKMLKNCNFLQKHFDSEYNFLYLTYDKNTKKNTVKKLQISITAERQLLQRLRKHGRPGQEGKKLHNFKDFLQKCLALNPKDRMTPQEAFLHPFLNYQIKLS